MFGGGFVALAGVASGNVVGDCPTEMWPIEVTGDGGCSFVDAEVTGVGSIVVLVKDEVAYVDVVGDAEAVAVMSCMVPSAVGRLVEMAFGLVGESSIHRILVIGFNDSLAEEGRSGGSGG